MVAVFSHRVPPGQNGARLAEYLSARFPYHTLPEWLGRIGDGHVRVEGRPATPETLLAVGARVEYALEDYEEPAVPLDFHDVVRAECVALLHKPAGLPVHKTGKVFVHTLANLHGLRHGREWSPLHRLDVETSGLVAFARGREALRRLAPTRPGTHWRKLYVAGVRGEPEAQGRLEFPLAENPADPIRSKMHPHPAGKPACTLYRRLSLSPSGALLLLRPLTGRKHQIRAHCAAGGFPVRGDKIYGCDGRFYLKRMSTPLTSADLEALGAPHHLLHALHLDIRDENGMGITGTDFEVPAAFLRAFPEWPDLAPSLPESLAWRELLDAE